MYCLASTVHNLTSVRIFRGRLGPYARHTLILTILRGLVAYGRGEPSGGYVTKRWILAGADGERLAPLENVAKHRYIIATYHRMLDYVSLLTRSYASNLSLLSFTVAPILGLRRNMST